MGVTVLQQFSMMENRTGPQTIEFLTKRILALGALQVGQFIVDCETYMSVPQLDIDQFVGTHGNFNSSIKITLDEKQRPQNNQNVNKNDDADDDKRFEWTNSTQFLMSCIAYSVGLGNVWRFPHTAYENGGGAFLIPYIIVLFIIGKPFYYMEMILGQFSSNSCIKIWSISPAFKGIGFGLTVAVFSITTYYCALMSLTLYYFIVSFESPLPWTKCSSEWGDTCIDSTSSFANLSSSNITKSSSAELYFRNTVLKENSINNGLGSPSYVLVLCLGASWISVFIVLYKGIKSSGKASYFLALFPYIILLTLLVRAVTLDGAIDGIIYLYKPNWSMILNPKVWYAAVTQAFFSLGVCCGAVTMFSSYNQFSHNATRDCIIITTMDFITSLISGTTIFGILGNLAHELGTDDFNSVVRSGTGLAFISYPEALGKFTILPELFSIFFFLMLFILGIGSQAGMVNVVISVFKDQFYNVKQWKISLGVCFTGFIVGIIYCTPSGQYILNLVDYYGGTFIIVVLACFEIIAISWIYGIENFSDDIEFMLGKRPSFYWKLCWRFLTPVMLFLILFYFLFTMTPIRYNDEYYPTFAYVAGWMLLAIGVVPLPILFGLLMYRNQEKSWQDIWKSTEDWGPKNSKLRKEWKQFKELKRKE